VCDYVYCLESGVQIADGPPETVIENPEVIASFLGRGRASGAVDS
jgi:ABC-type branched-subunit amino acid transport system ATPase component